MSFAREIVAVGKASPDILVIQKSVPSYLHSSHGRRQDEVKNAKKISGLQSSFRKQLYVFLSENIIVDTEE